MARDIKTASGQGVTVSSAIWPKGHVAVNRENTLDDRGQDVLILKPMDALVLAIQLVEAARAELDRE